MSQLERVRLQTPLDLTTCKCQQTVPLRVRRSAAEVAAAMEWISRALRPWGGLWQVLAMAHTTYHDHCHWCGRPATCTIAVNIHGSGIERLACPGHAPYHGHGVDA